MTTMSSRDFNRDTAAAKRAASLGPVVITDRERPAHVLLTWEEYQRLVAGSPTPMSLYADEDVAHLELPLPPRTPPRVTEPLG